MFKISHLTNMRTTTDYANTNVTAEVSLNFENLSQFICLTNGYSCSVFNDNKRSLLTFKEATVIGLDVDDGCTLEQAISLFKSYKCIIATTKSHQIEKNGVVCDRFRVLLFLNEPVTTAAGFQATWLSLYRQFPFIDVATKDASRFYSPSKEVVFMNEDGNLVDTVRAEATPVKSVSKNEASTKGRLSTATKYFLNIGNEPGTWNVSLFKATKDMQEQGFSQQEALEKFQNMENENYNGTLDAHDLATISSAYRIEPKYDKRVPNNIDKSEPLLAIKNLLLKEGYSPEFNILKQRIFIKEKGALTDLDLSLIRNACRSNAIRTSTEVIMDVLTESALANKYCPFEKALSEITYDGKDYITELWKTIEIQDDFKEYEDIYFQQFKVWLVGVVAKVFCNSSNQAVLTLLGGQGLGKSTWTSKLFSFLGNDAFCETSINPENKDHLLIHSNFYGCNISELDSVTRKTDVAALKNFLTMDAVTVRKAYDRLEQTSRSVCSFVASLNSDKFLADDQNRRFFIIPVKSLDFKHNIDMRLVYAQALSEFKNGTAKNYLSMEQIRQLNQMNEAFSTEDKLDGVARRVKPGVEELTIHEVFEEFYNGYKYHHADATKLGILLTKKGIQKLRKRIDGAPKNVYLVSRPKFN